jgi:tetratricopeptide (TPR) repeat protein
MSKFRRFCKCIVISGVLMSCGRAETLSAPTEGADILDHVRDLFNNSRIEEARALLTGPRLEVIRKSNPVVDAAVTNDLGVIFDKQGMFRDAEDAYNRAIGLLEHAEGGDTPALIDPLANLANLFYECSLFSRAEALLTREIAILDVSTSGEPDKRSVAARSALAKVYLSEHKYDLATETAKNLIKARDERDERFRLGAALGYSVLGSVSTQEGRLPPAEALFHTALSILENTLSPDDVRIGEAKANLGLFYAASHDMGTAEPLLEDAHQRLNASGSNNLFRRSFLLRFAEAESRSGHKQRARELLNEAHSLAARNPANVIAQYVVDASAWRQ